MGLLVVAAALMILYFAWRFFRLVSPKNFAEALAKAQLRCYRTLKSTNPNLECDETYSRIIEGRHGYDKSTAGLIIADAKISARNSGAAYGFRAVVVQLALYEFQKLTSLTPTEDEQEKIIEGVNSVIPLDI